MPTDCVCPSFKDDVKRFLMASIGLWRVRYQIGRKSKLKWWPAEAFHALKNIPVEQLRRWGHDWDRL